MICLITFLAGEDYRPQQKTIGFNTELETQCVSFELMQDNLVENTESMVVRIRNDDRRISIDQTNDIVTFSVEDSDSESE